jgi:hypothetical protein
MEVEMHGTQLWLENHSEEAKQYLIRRRESEPSAIKEVCAGSRKITWNSANGYVNLGVELNPGEQQMIEIRFQNLDANGRSKESLSHRAKAMLRRYLCEIRDNYITTTKSRLASFVVRERRTACGSAAAGVGVAKQKTP